MFLSWLACASESHKHPIKNTSCPWFHEVPVRVGLRIRQCGGCRPCQMLAEGIHKGGAAVGQEEGPGSWRNGSVVKSTKCSCRGTGLGYQHPCQEAYVSYNSSSKGSSALVYTLRVSAVGCVHSHVQPHTHIYTKK